MGRKHGVFSVQLEEVNISTKKKTIKRYSITIQQALETVYQQMRIAGNRIRTIESYDYIFNQFVQFNILEYVEDITADSIYEYLGSLEVAQQTKLIRLKSIKAVLSKFHNNGWMKQKFWSTIHIKIDKQVKKGAKVDDIEKLIELIDQNTFIGFRDTVAILTMYKTGIRIQTLRELKERHIDYENLSLNLDGSILKNHKFLKLPIDQELADLFKILIMQNDKIRSYYNSENTNIIITQNGLPINNSKASNNAISKQLNKYSKRFGLEYINAHAIRRGYAKKLLDAGASIAIISKALGHSDLGVTTQYLDLDVEEVASSLREYL
ncbi:tyrosine-type recombinase/integrase [Psychrobacillus psychrodurans]|uniref:Site-specific integrase n=1 Tax=Psychrobacillus psychrodurans TaxID=126157 RepID=A0A9X3L8X0_9BACI|nr:site-specific integrase [Psychrobacillus psychrodurans]MCZ8533380.1 site-specific integrase [Psychrobacillus psychrodurans]